MLDIPIFLIIYFTGIILFLFSFKYKDFFLILFPLVALFQLLNYNIDYDLSIYFNLLATNISIIKIDEMNKFYGILFICSLIITNIYALKNNNKIELIFSQIYAGSALGAILTNNILIAFLFLEIMSLTATFIICSTNKKESLLAGFRYFFIHLLAGILFLIGIIFYYKYHQDFLLKQIKLEAFYSYFILLGLGINAGFPFFHTWIPDSYSKASYTGTVYLSIFTTKTAIYWIFRLFQGEEILILIGVVMSFFSIFYAILENDLRKILSYLLINQLGFLLVSIGINNELGYNSFYFLVFSHVIYDTILFMAAGAILYFLKSVYLSELSNLYNKMPIVVICFIIASLALSGFPGTLGYIGKTMLYTALKKDNYIITYLLLLFSSAGITFLVLFKIPYEIFFPKNNYQESIKLPINISISLTILTISVIFFGILPHLLTYLIPAKWSLDIFKITKIFEKIQFLSFIFLSFLFLKKNKLIPESKKAIYLDVDWFVRKPFYNLILSIDKISQSSKLYLFSSIKSFSQKTLHLHLPFEKEKIDSIGNTILLSLMLLFFFTIILIIN